MRSVIFLLAVLATVNCSLFFQETFDEKSDAFASGKWVKSDVDKYHNQPVRVMPSGSAPEGFQLDHGVQLTQEMKHYGFGSVFNEPIAFTPGDDLVVQYELKFEEALNCGGAYIKLLRDTTDLSSLDSQSPYTIMFGPDKCGGTNKVHFIVQHQNPVTKVWEEKHYNETIPVRADRHTHLYTLVLRKDQSFDIFVDEKLAKSGNLLTHMLPSINPPTMIDDPTDSKPEDWVDAPTIVDPDARKPDDWDENAPKKIPDENAKKPATWLDDAPLKIPNPDVSKPEDWDDEEDGEWEAPLIDNPDCDKAGCGPWSPPLIPNPAYKGKWSPPMIANPAYQGEWKARQIPNPAFFKDLTPLQSLAPMTALAVEVWTTNGGIHFDNFVIGSVADVQDFTRKTFAMKAAAEHVQAKAEQQQNKDEQFKSIMRSGSALDKGKVLIRAGLDYLQERPVLIAVSVLAMIIAFLMGMIFNVKTCPEKEKEVETQPKEENNSDAKSESENENTKKNN
jgi:calnexin